MGLDFHLIFGHFPWEICLLRIIVLDIMVLLSNTFRKETAHDRQVLDFAA